MQHTDLAVRLVCAMETSWCHKIGQWAAVALLASGWAGSGCTPKGPVGDLLKPLLSPKPSQVAREAFSVDPDVARKNIGLLATSSFGDGEPYVRFYRLQCGHEDVTVRAVSVRALGNYGTVEDVSLLAHLLTDDDSVAVRWEAAKALQKIHSSVAVVPLIGRLAETGNDFAEESADVRMAAAFALGQYPQPRVFHALVGALDDTEYGVVSTALRSLKILTGYDFGTDGSLWLIWAGRHSDDLFHHRENYTWSPYNKPPGLVDSLKFWKKHEVKGPQPARGKPLNDE